MSKAEYLRRAEDCERLAQLVRSEEYRRKILNIAQGWRELAEKSEPAVAPRAA